MPQTLIPSQTGNGQASSVSHSGLWRNSQGRQCSKACSAWRLSCLVNTACVSIAAFNMACAYFDDTLRRKETKGQQERGAAAGSASGYEAVVIANLCLVVGALFRRQLLVAIWLCTYAFILAVCCVQSITEDEFPWTPGVSRTAGAVIADALEMRVDMRPVAAVALMLACFSYVFIVFMARGVMKMPGAPDSNNGTTAATDAERGVRNVPQEESRRMDLWEFLRQAQLSEQENNSNSRESLPSYSELEVAAAESADASVPDERNAAPPPQYDDAVKSLNGSYFEHELGVADVTQPEKLGLKRSVNK